ncbi:Uncharacterised protein [Shigella sonnei]|nr:Uncharacterised protein [Shigella sonnei]
MIFPWPATISSQAYAYYMLHAKRSLCELFSAKNQHHVMLFLLLITSSI